MCQQIPEYLAVYERLEAEKTYETLCTLYVALTRAKQSLQVLLPAAPKREGSLGTIANWLRFRIDSSGSGQGNEWTDARSIAGWGTSDWADSVLPAEDFIDPAPEPFRVREGQKSLPRMEPSREASHLQIIGKEFRFFENDGRALGSRVHALLEKVRWADTCNLESFLREQREPLDSEASNHVRNAFQMQEMSQPDGAVDLWREQRFESILPEGWITGIFDRVVCFRDGAWIQDFKTNDKVNASTIEKYRFQMELYRRVLADMLGFQENAIRCQLLFTKMSRVVEV